MADKGIGENEIDEFINEFPVIYAVAFNSRPSVRSWCFTGPNLLRRHDFVIGIGVSSDNDNPVDIAFAIPTKELGCSDISLFSDKDVEYAKYFLEGNKVEEKLSSIAKELRMRL